MASRSIAAFINPWKHRREQQAERLAMLRERDGDSCRRCRRPIRFDLPAGHDLGVKVEKIVPEADTAAARIDNLCLTHGRCNVSGRDHTEMVMERLRPEREAELFVKARNKRKAA